jgi:hypothetical protein
VIFLVAFFLAAPKSLNQSLLERTGGESGIVFRPISEITATMEKSFYPFVIADTFEIAAMKFDGG